jgi:protein TonB
MTTLVARIQPGPINWGQISWPRIGALSGAMSLHLSLALLLLMPPVAMQLIRQVREEPIVVRVIDPPPKVVQVVEPVLPTPREKTPPPRPVQHHVDVTHVDPPVTTTESVMSYPAVEDHGTPDIGPTAQDVAPTALGYGSRTTVKYPMDALRRREHGTVILRVLVGTDGTPQQIEVETSSGSPRLDSAARDAVRQWTFRPGTRNGAAQSAWARVPITFDLTQL